MKKLILLFLLSLSAYGQATQPSKPYPVLVFFQPERNIKLFVSLGVNTFAGPEIENSGSMTQAQIATARASWIKAVADAGGKVILKNPTVPLPANCVGMLMSVDEPNGKGVLPAQLKADSAALRAIDATIPIYLSLAGDKVTSANFNKPSEAQLYKDYASLADILTVDMYSVNRNASRYPTTWTGDGVAKLAALVGKPVVAWVECSDQKLLPAPKSPDIARGPTGAEIVATVDYAVSEGAKGIGWFATSSRGAYGWPQSYAPMNDEQLNAMKAVAIKLNPPATQPVQIHKVLIDGVEYVPKQ